MEVEAKHRATLGAEVADMQGKLGQILDLLKAKDS